MHLPLCAGTNLLSKQLDLLFENRAVYSNKPEFPRLSFTFTFEKLRLVE